MFYHTFEPNEVAFFRNTLRPGDVFVDAGAFIGFYSALALSEVGPDGGVIAFEPMPNWFMTLNSLSKQAERLGRTFFASQTALSDIGGKADLLVPIDHNMASSTIIESQALGHVLDNTYEVETVRLDTFLRSASVKSPRIVKIDVEGAEDKVLAGMSGVFEGGDFPILMIEPRTNSWDSVKAILSDWGYNSYRCEKGGQISAVDRLENTKSYLVIWLHSETNY